MVEAGFDHDALNAMDEPDFLFWLAKRGELIALREEAAKKG
ncbi:hypothetical protein [Hoeflea sp.]|nr:hypothetical protein [Hoeflea sp.]